VLHIAAADGLIILLEEVSVKAVGDEQLLRRVTVVSLYEKVKHCLVPRNGRLIFCTE